jgi:chloramphenicol 3-O-phosphotransferase
MPKKLKSYRVWIHQVNQTYVDVKATDEWSAREKGYEKWRKEEAHSEVSYVEENEEENNK